MNEIPPVTHQCGKYWKQPTRERIVIDDTHAVMTLATLEQLAEYSATLPTGAYEGKMWRKCKYDYDLKTRTPSGWWLMWYSDAGPDMCAVNVREVLLV